MAPERFSCAPRPILLHPRRPAERHLDDGGQGLAMSDVSHELGGGMSWRPPFEKDTCIRRWMESRDSRYTARIMTRNVRYTAGARKGPSGTRCESRAL